MNIRVGSICKFEDFEPVEGRLACYKIGQVTEIKGDIIFYTILLDIWQGENFANTINCMDRMTLASCPIPGRLYFDWPSRIQVIS